jgi:hypothetical protein
MITKDKAYSSEWHRKYRDYLVDKGIPVKMAIERTNTKEDGILEDPVVVAKRDILDDLSGQL